MSSNFFMPYILTIILAWFMAHVIKYFVSRWHKEKYKLRSHIFRSGGMPSAHSATTVALAMIVGLKDGFESSLFAIALLFAIIVMYDAVKVRRSAGEQGLAIRSIVKEIKSEIEVPRIAKGHTPLEVVLGAVLA
jgi:acid phosphatase family membrane protein YuiD